MMKTLAVLVDWQLRSPVSWVSSYSWASYALLSVLCITERSNEGRVR
jgi:hypothetical protein